MSEEIVERVCKFAFDRERLAINIDTEVGLTILDEIVRCRDCRHTRVENGFLLCTWWSCGACEGACNVESDGFCSWGERR